MFWKVIGKKIFYCLTVLAAIIAWLILTESGLLFSFWVVRAFAPGTLSIGHISGKWADTIQIKALNYQTSTVQITIQALMFKPQLSALIKNNAFIISKLQLKTAYIQFKEKSIQPLIIDEMHISEPPHNHAQIDCVAKLTWQGIQAHIQGFLQSHGTATEAPTITGQWILYPGTLTPVFAKIKQPISYLGGKVNFILNQQELKAHFEFKQNNQNSVLGELIIPSSSLLTKALEQPIQGTLTSTWNDLTFLDNFIPNITKLKGALLLSGKLGGSLKSPILHLTVNSEKISFFIPKQNLKINNLILKAVGVLPGNLTLEGSGASGTGQFQFKGVSALKTSFKTQLKITGENIDIYNTPNTKIIATPDITVDYIHPILYVQGTVYIPYANIIVMNEKNQAVHSKDIIFTDTNHTQEHTNPVKVIPRLHLIIKNRLHFVGYHLDGMIGGKLAIDQRPDGLLTGNGKLTIKEGKYRLQGATRYIHKGYLLFPAGTLLTDPLLDIRILQKHTPDQQEGEVGIYVQGTLQKPILQPYSSNTNLHSTQILSRLGFGNTETNDDNQRQVIAQTAFLLAGTNPLIDFIQSSLNLEEFNIESKETHKSFFNQGGTDTELVIGKSLSDKFYLQYVQSVLNPLTTIRLKYFLGRYFTLSAETNSEEDVGGDLTFSLEKD